MLKLITCPYYEAWRIWHVGRLLIWEECHYEPSKSSPPTRLSGAESTEIPFGEWEKLLMPSETCSSQLGNQSGDRVSALISKMMISNQVNVLGEGYGFSISKLLGSV